MIEILQSYMYKSVSGPIFSVMNVLGYTSQSPSASKPIYFDIQENWGTRRLTEGNTVKCLLSAWHEYSIVTVDRRKGRDQAVMKHKEYCNKFGSFPVPEDIVLERFVSKRNEDMVLNG